MHQQKSLNGPCGCTNQLVVIERNGIEIDYCPQCRGVWLDRGELEKILELEGKFLTEQLQQARVQQPAAPAPAPQPAPQQPMQPQYQQPVQPQYQQPTVPTHLQAPRPVQPVQPYAVPVQPVHVIPGVPVGHYYDYSDYKYYKKYGKKPYKKSFLGSIFDALD